MNQQQKFLKGEAIEEHVCALLPEAKLTHQTDFYDIDFGNKKIEVKSADLIVLHGRKEKAFGKFIVNIKCHEKLLTINGFYCFVLTFKGNPILIGFIEAKKTKPIRNGRGHFFRLPVLYKTICLKEFLEGKNAD